MAMPETYTLPLSKIIHELQLEATYLPRSADDILIQSRDVVRPGMELSGYLEYFDPTRIAVVGRAEIAMVQSWRTDKRSIALESYFSQQPPAVIFARGIEPSAEMRALASRYAVPILRTTESTSNIVASLVAYLNVELAPRITRHGVLVEVYGEGILLVGDSGVGKSETAIELIKRGHRLIADDAVEIKRNVTDRLVGTAPELIRHYIELRGIGVIDVCRLFGMSAVKDEAEIDMVINLEQWKDGAMYDRLGLENLYTTILDVQVPSLTVPVRPGRNLAVIIEVAAMNNRHKKMGYNAAVEFTKQINQHFDQAMSAQLNDN